jgi:hypothetical protein
LGFILAIFLSEILAVALAQQAGAEVNPCGILKKLLFLVL